MNRHLCRLVLIALVVLVLVACGKKDDTGGKLPSDPVEALQEISKTGQNLKSAHFTMDVAMDMDAEGFQVAMEMDAEGDVEMKGPSPDDANMSMTMNLSMLGQKVSMDMVMLDGQVWMRESGGTWQPVPADQANLTSGLGSDPTTFLRYLDNAKDVKRLKDEKIDGVDTFHYGFTMDADALSTAEMLGQLSGTGQLTEQQAQDALESAVLEGEVWVGKEDLFARRQTVNMQFSVSGLPGLGDATVKYDMQVDMKFSKLNEPVEIQAPTN